MTAAPISYARHCARCAAVTTWHCRLTPLTGILGIHVTCERCGYFAAMVLVLTGSRRKGGKFDG